jgi:acetyltransferase-like isoleucine patch superfamily enzyme
MVGANSVVTSDVPGGMLAAGSPARVIRAVPNQDEGVSGQ